MAIYVLGDKSPRYISRGSRDINYQLAIDTRNTSTDIILIAILFWMVYASLLKRNSSVCNEITRMRTTLYKPVNDLIFYRKIKDN